MGVSVRFPVPLGPPGLFHFMAKPPISCGGGFSTLALGTLWQLHHEPTLRKVKNLSSGLLPMIPCK